MTKFGDIISSGLEQMAHAPRRREGDIMLDGLVYCGVCGEKRQAVIDWMPDADGKPRKRIVPVLCKCEQQDYDEQKAKDRREQFMFNLKSARDHFGIQPRNVDKQTFDNDDSASHPISRTCREYVEKWPDMRENNMGMLLYGNKGTGKSFYAACIVNALAERQVPTAMTTTALLMSIMQGTWDKASVIDNLNRFSLLVLDDLGAERDTAYGSEIMYNVIDGRYRAKKPLIVTTNLDLADMANETDIWRSRIYDRVLEMCPIAIKMEGVSRRSEIADERKQMARDFLRNARRAPADGD